MTDFTNLMPVEIKNNIMIKHEIYKKIVGLSWKILEAKYWYYYRCEPKIQDYEYDMMEKEYEVLCKIYSIEPTASNMVDFDESRPSCQAIMSKFGTKPTAPQKKIRKKKKDIVKS